jgi:uncharacterized protein YidB (DUF937 family)
MGLLDSLGSVVQDVMAGKQIDLLGVAEQALSNAGGVNGILGQLQQAGLGDQVSSWISKGQNLPISAEQISSALSHPQLQSLASSFGVDLEQVPALLAQHLPAAVDAASPDGVLPS